MRRDRIFYTRTAKGGLDLLPVEARMHLETHLGNLTLVLEATPERLPQLLAHVEGAFVTTVQGARALFTVDTSARSLLVHRVEALNEVTSEAGGEGARPEEDPWKR